MSLCLIGLGSNEGDRQAAILGAVDALGRQPGIRVLRQSRPLQTAPVGGPSGQGLVLNAAVLVETALEPDALLAVLAEVENALGRRREEPWGPRTIDLDLLLYNELVRSTPALVLPHPRMAWRRFVLEPAAEIAGEMVHPTTRWTVAHLLDHLNTAKNYLAIAGPVGAGTTSLAVQFVQSAEACWIADTPDLAAIDAFCADPSSNCWAIGLEFVERRSRLLGADSSEWRRPARLWVSDFWFDQCLAFARVWLPAERWAAFAARWEAAAGRVVRPKLVVMLDAATERLLERVGELGGPAAACWTREALDRLREALDWCVRRPDVGPVLRLVDQPPEAILREVSAAAEAMR